MSSTAFVTGANGYIGQHVVKLLLSKDYRVVGAVRTEEKGEHLKKLTNSSQFSYEVVPDITVPGAFDHVFVNSPAITKVLHTASPLSLSPEDIEGNLLKPSVEGTKSLLKSIKSHGKNVQRVVITSSIAANGCTPGHDYNNEVVNEESWTEITHEQALSNGFFGYTASKVFAERAAWDFVKNEGVSFELSTVCPPFVLGPAAYDSEVKENFGFSAAVVGEFINIKSTDPIPPFEGMYFDVRDAAKAHLVAVESTEAIGQRLALFKGKFNCHLIADIVREKFPQLRDQIPKSDEAVTNTFLKSIAGGIYDNSKTLKILNFEPLSLDQIVVDTIEQAFKVRN